MRLNEQQLEIIRSGVSRHLGEYNGLWLFGSRVDDQRRGGDVDLYVETPTRKPLKQALRCKIELEEKLDLHVDLVINSDNDDKPIFNIAKETGVRL
jgi:predicted nucleotidyltransferase